MNIPENLKYTKSHEWVKLEGAVATIGITEFAVEQLGDVTLVELPAAGDRIVEGDSMGTIESVKAVSDLYAPLTGQVTKVNDALDGAPEQVNDDCYGGGWMVKVDLGEEDLPDTLMDATSYEEYLDSLD